MRQAIDAESTPVRKGAEGSPDLMLLLDLHQGTLLPQKGLYALKWLGHTIKSPLSPE